MRIMGRDPRLVALASQVLMFVMAMILAMVCDGVIRAVTMTIAALTALSETQLYQIWHPYRYRDYTRTTIGEVLHNIKISCHSIPCVLVLIVAARDGLAAYKVLYVILAAILLRDLAKHVMFYVKNRKRLLVEEVMLG